MRDATVRTDSPFTAARAYADPTSVNGKPLTAAQDRLTNSLSALSKTIPPEKIFYFQISDGSYKHGVDALKKTSEKQGIDPLYAWSNAWRPLPFQDEIEGKSSEEGYGGYLPVVEICEAVLKTGWKGPWSYEVCRIGLSQHNQAKAGSRCFTRKIWRETILRCRRDGRGRRGRVKTGLRPSCERGGCRWCSPTATRSGWLKSQIHCAAWITALWRCSKFSPARWACLVGVSCV